MAIMRTTIRRIGWMVAIWVTSVATLGIVALAIRLLAAPHKLG